jgi:hypothetical protein
VGVGEPNKETQNMKSHGFSQATISVAAIVVFLATVALAGPPLVCRRIDIGDAKSLPWVDLNYKNGSGGYDLKNLTRDTLAILNSTTPILVRMETLRRATIYARQDPQVAKELLTRLHVRAVNSDEAGHPDALAWFDAGYLAETYKQWMGNAEPNPANGIDGYGWVKKAISLRGNDAEMEFAAALITLTGPEGAHREHTQKAMGGMTNDPLLAKNLGASFNLATNVPAQASKK